MLYVLGLACLDMMISNAAMYIPSAGIAVMLIAQCFYTVDPLTVAAFGGVDTGSGKMVYVGIEDGDRYYGDYLIYNTQYLWIDRVMDKLLADSDYDGTQDIILFNDYGGSQIAGNDPLYYYNWDKRLKKRVFYSNENTVKKLEKQVMVTDSGIEISIPMETYNKLANFEVQTDVTGKSTIIIRNIDNLVLK